MRGLDRSGASRLKWPGSLRVPETDTQRWVRNYLILAPIGRGGMATVYLARDEDLERYVALKALDLPDEDGDLIARFLRESRLAAGLSHQNIVTVHARLEHEGVPY